MEVLLLQASAILLEIFSGGDHQKETQKFKETHEKEELFLLTREAQQDFHAFLPH